MKFRFITAILVEADPGDYSGACEKVRSEIDFINRNVGDVEIQMPPMEPEQLNEVPA